MRFTSWALAAAVALGGAGLGAAPAVAAAELTCGATVSGEVELTRTLRCDRGITVEGPATIDLKGHRLTGPGAEVAGSVGLNVDGEAGDVLVRDGRISGWQQGVVVSEGPVVLGGLTVTGNTTGIYNWSGDFQLRAAVVVANRYGLQNELGFADLDSSTFRDNGTAILGTASGLRVAASTFVGNETGLQCEQSSCDLTGVRFRDNAVGVEVGWQSNLESTGDRYLDNGTGFRQGAVSNSSSITGATFTGNGTAIDSGGTMTLSDSLFTRNETAVRYDEWTGRDDPDGAPAAATADRAADGAGPLGSITGNRFRDNGDALYMLTRAREVAGNTAVDNTGWGLYAPYAVDGGGNKARRNGKQPQCTGVVCS